MSVHFATFLLVLVSIGSVSLGRVSATHHIARIHWKSTAAQDGSPPQSLVGEEAWAALRQRPCYVALEKEQEDSRSGSIKLVEELKVRLLFGYAVVAVHNSSVLGRLVACCEEQKDPISFQYRVERVVAPHPKARREAKESQQQRSFHAQGQQRPSNSDKNGLTYQTNAQITQRMFDIASRFPALASVKAFGTTGEGRNIYLLRMTLAATTAAAPSQGLQDTPQFLLIGAHHAREWISVEIVIGIAEYFANHFQTHSAIRNMMYRSELIFIPVFNPDGYEHSFQAQNTRYWRKNRRYFDFARAYGVDLNRNYPIDFGGPGSSGVVQSDIFRGTAAFSEKETSALDALLKSSDLERLAGSLAYHSFGNYIFYPYGYRHGLYGPNEKFLSDLGGLMSKSMTTKGITGGIPYKVLKGTDVYPVSGDAADYYYLLARYAPTYTVEARPSDYDCCAFELPVEQIRVCVTENIALTWTMMEYVTSVVEYSKKNNETAAAAPGGVIRGIDWASHSLNWTLYVNASHQQHLVDSDNDGVPDFIDLCPLEPNLASSVEYFHEQRSSLVSAATPPTNSLVENVTSCNGTEVHLIASMQKLDNSTGDASFCSVELCASITPTAYKRHLEPNPANATVVMRAALSAVAAVPLPNVQLLSASATTACFRLCGFRSVKEVDATGHTLVSNFRNAASASSSSSSSSVFFGALELRSGDSSAASRLGQAMVACILSSLLLGLALFM